MPATKTKADFLSLVRSYLPTGSKPKAADWAVVREMADTQKRIKKAAKKAGYSELVAA